MTPNNDERRPGGSGVQMSVGDVAQFTVPAPRMAGGEPIGWPPPPCPCSICLGFADPVPPPAAPTLVPGTFECRRCRITHLRTDPFCVARQVTR